MPLKDPEQLSIPPDGRPYAEQPQWRRDFPIDWPHDEYIARRDFTKYMVLTSFAFVVGQAWIVMQNWFRQREGKPPIRKITSLAALPVGKALTFNYPDPHDACIMMRTAENTVVAYSQKCTHLSCAVKPKEGTNQLHCPCHNGYFDIADGKPLAGPPRRPLDRITLEVRGGEIYATGVEQRTV
jgi:Rieske Fe-S protein